MIEHLLNSVIARYRDFADQLFALPMSNGKLLICSPLTNPDISLNLVHLLLVMLAWKRYFTPGMLWFHNYS